MSGGFREGTELFDELSNYELPSHRIFVLVSLLTGHEQCELRRTCHSCVAAAFCSGNKVHRQELE
jgi:hypothetical protein